MRPFLPSASAGIPLTGAQQRMVVLHRHDPKADILARAFRLRGNLDRQALAQAVAWSASKGPVLSSVLVESAGTSCRRPGEPVHLQIHDVLPGGDRFANALEALQTEAERPFDLAFGQLLRVMLFPIADDDHLFLFHAHHLVVDGYSITLGLKYVVEAYVALTNGAVPVPHDGEDALARIAVEEREYRLSAKGAEDAAYWCTKIRLMRSPDRHTAGPRVPIDCSVVPGHLDVAERELVARAAQHLGTTEAGLYAAAFQQVLETVQPGTALTTTFSLRRTPKMLRVIGPLFVYGLLGPAGKEEPFLSRARRLGDEIRLGQVHARSADTIGPHGCDPDALPVSQTALIGFHAQKRFGSLALGAAGHPVEITPGVLMETLAMPKRLVPYGLFLSVGMLPQGATLLLVYNRTLHTEPDASSILAEVRQILLKSAGELTCGQAD